MISDHFKCNINLFVEKVDKQVSQGVPIKEALDEASKYFTEEELRNMAQWIICQF